MSLQVSFVSGPEQDWPRFGGSDARQAALGRSRPPGIFVGSTGPWSSPSRHRRRPARRLRSRPAAALVPSLRRPPDWRFGQMKVTLRLKPASQSRPPADWRRVRPRASSLCLRNRSEAGSAPRVFNFACGSSTHGFLQKSIAQHASCGAARLRHLVRGSVQRSSPLRAAERSGCACQRQPAQPPYRRPDVAEGCLGSSAQPLRSGGGRGCRQRFPAEEACGGGPKCRARQHIARNASVVVCKPHSRPAIYCRLASCSSHLARKSLFRLKTSQAYATKGRQRFGPSIWLQIGSLQPG
jgi:hypothetical protein